MKISGFGFLRRLALVLVTTVVCFFLAGISATPSFAAVAPDGTSAAASGTYTYPPGASGPLAWDITNSDFLCDGPSFGPKTVQILSLTETTLTWLESGESDQMTWTRDSGTAGDITGTWVFSDPVSGNSYAMAFDGFGVISFSANIAQCGGGNGSLSIASFSPASGVAGSLVRIYGSNFSPLTTSNTVLFNGVPAVVTGVNPGSISVLVPAGAESGTISVNVFDSGSTATSSSPFTVTSGTPAATLSWGGVHHRIDADGVEFDALDVGISSYASDLSGMTLYVSGPNGFSYFFDGSEISPYINGQLALYKKYLTPDSPLEAGVYTFTLDDNQGHVSHRVDTHVSPALPLPQVDSNTIQMQRRADGSYKISWAPLNDTKTYYYRLRIARNNAASTPVYDSSRTMSSFADVPTGILFDDAMYKVRVDAFDSANDDLATNRSDSAWTQFSPTGDDYNSNKLLTSYAVVTNRTNNGETRTFDAMLGVNDPTKVTALTLTGPGEFTYNFNITEDVSLSTPNGTTQTKIFYKNFPNGTVMPAGLYTFSYETALGGNQTAYTTLTDPVIYPAVDVATMQAQDLGNGNIRFSWANVDHTGTLYYRVNLNGPVSYATPRLNQAFADIPKSIVTGGTYTFSGWRVEVYDSSEVTTQRNRFHSTTKSPLSYSAYDAAAPVLSSFKVRNQNLPDGSSATNLMIFATDADDNGTITERRVDGPSGYTRNLTTPDRYTLGAYSLTEAGSPETGLYTVTAVDNTAKSAVRYKFQPEAHPVPVVDYQSFKLDLEPNGDPRISWAPVVSDVPLWYYLEAYNAGTLAPVIIPNTVTAGTMMQQTSVTVPASYMQGQTMFRIVAFDDGSSTTYNNTSRSVMVKAQPGIDYTGLSDNDNDGYASNVDPDDNNLIIDPFWSTTASGTYLFVPGTLTWTFTNSNFLCEGPRFGYETVDVLSLTATTMVWQNSPTDTMTWTRASGTAGDITGTWSLIGGSNTYLVTFNPDGTVSVVATILQCGSNNPTSIASFSPTSGIAGSLVTINGSNFSPITTNNTVLFNGVPAVVTGVQSGHIFAIVPTGATDGPISVINSGNTATSSSSFTVTTGTPAATLTRGGVHHRIDSDGVEFDALDIGISSYAATLTGMTLSVSGPDDDYTFTDEDIKPYINGQLALYRKFLTEEAPLTDGVYTFTLDDGQGHISHRVDTHVADAWPLPQVGGSTIQMQRKSDGSYRVSWAPLSDTNTYNYSLHINRNDATESPVYDSVRRMTSYVDLPAGILFDDSMYKVRVEAVDSPNGDLATNSSLSEWKLFSPKGDDYNSERLLTNYAVVNNRTDNGEAQTFDAILNVSDPTKITSLILTGPEGFTPYEFDLGTDISRRTTDGSDQVTDFYHSFPNDAALPPGLYTFTYETALGGPQSAYATLTDPVIYPAVDETTLQAQDLGNNNIRFSWATVDYPGALYYRVILTGSTPVTISYVTSRQNQAFVDIPKSIVTGTTYPLTGWRVEVYDSSDVTTQRNRFNSTNKNLTYAAYDAANPVINSYRLLNMTASDGMAYSHISVSASASQTTLSQVLVTRPDTSSVNLLAAGRYAPSVGAYVLEEQGTLASGLYTITVTDTSAKSVIRYMYVPAVNALEQPDYTTFRRDFEPNGDMRISWAPIISDTPVWYSFSMYAQEDLNSDSLIDQVYGLNNVQKASIVIPAATMSQWPQSPLLGQVWVSDGSNDSVTSYISKSSMVDSFGNPVEIPFSAGNDSLATAVVSTAPANSATGVATSGSTISVTFNKVIDQRSLSASFTLNNGITGAVTYNPLTRTATFLPSSSLQAGATYTATVSTSLLDPAGSSLGTAYSWSFTTAGITVTPFAGSNGTIFPSTEQSVNSGATASFIITPSNGFQIGGIFGTCPSGTWNGNQYTTGSVTTSCTVSVTFTAPPVNGLCGAAWNRYFRTAPTANFCAPDIALTPTPTNGTLGWTWDCPGSNGGHPVTCFAYQDNNGPLLFLTTLADGDKTAGEVLNITGNAFDINDIAAININGIDLPVAATGFNHAIRLVKVPAVNTITITAIDGLGNISTATRFITYDTALPAITLGTSPADSSSLNGDQVTVTGSVANSSINSVISLNGTVISSTAGPSFNQNLSLVPGINTITVTAISNQDSSQFNTIKRTVTLDTAKPSLAITSPPEDVFTQNRSFTINGTIAAAAEEVILQYSIDNGVIWAPVSATTDGTTPGSFSISDTLANLPGTYPVIVRALRTSDSSEQVRTQRTIIYADSTVDAFAFTPQSGVATSVTVVSDTITITGINTQTSISISAGAEYSIATYNGSSWDAFSPWSTTTPNTVSNNDMIRIRLNSAPTFGGTVSATLTVGGVPGSFSVTTATAATPATGVIVTPTLASPQTTGTAVTFNAAGQGSSGYQYQFYLYDGTAWNLVQDYGAGSSWTLPGTVPAGNYTLAVNVRTSTAVTRDAVSYTAYQIAAAVIPATGVIVTPTLASPQTTGTAVTFNAAGQGSSGYQYQFYLYDGTAWNLVQDYGVGSSWTLPGTAPAGNYTLAVNVRTNTAVTRDAVSYTSYQIYVAATPATGVIVTPTLAAPQITGTAVTFNAAGQGSSGYQYQFYLYDGTAWNLVQDYGTGSSWTLPGTAPAGYYTLAVNVRTSTAVTRDAVSYTAYQIAATVVPATGVIITPSQPSPHSAGTAVTFTAAGQGSSGYEYRFQLFDGTTWTLVQDYGIGSSWLMPASSSPGNYTLAVDVRTSTVVYRDAVSYTSYTVVP